MNHQNPIEAITQRAVNPVAIICSRAKTGKLYKKPV
jgi:hypothetical protein